MKALRRKPDGEGDAGTDAKRELDRLRAHVAELEVAGKEVGRDRARADAELAAAREGLTATYAADEPPDAAQARLREAQAASAAPWDERSEAARRKVRSARGDLERFAVEHSAALWTEFGPRARAGADRLDELLAETRTAIHALALLEQEANALLLLQGVSPVGLIADRGLEQLAKTLKARAENPTPAPIPRGHVEEAAARPRAWIEA